MQINKKCKVCGTPFVAIKSNQYFCSRKCFKKDYNIRKRTERRIDRETNPERFGAYICSHCGLRTPLPYSPKRYRAKFETFECPGCKLPRFPNPENMREEWGHDRVRFGLGWKADEMPRYKDVMISMTFQTFLSNDPNYKPPED